MWLVIMVLVAPILRNNLKSSSALFAPLLISSYAERCSRSQLRAINKALPDRDGACSSSKYPWYNKCPISQITGCPDTPWLESHYRQDFGGESFLAVNIGCNKGYDAVNLLRMGSNNETVSKARWREAMPTAIEGGNCGQEETEYLVETVRNIRPAQVLCVEPMPGTFAALQQALMSTALQGLLVRQYAVNNHEPNTTLFPSANVGAEKQGIGGCYSKFPTRQERMQKSCEPVSTTRLDLLMEEENLLNQTVNVLLIDVEGWDFEVLKGGIQTLQRTAYLEFEFNWRGKWYEEERPLEKAINFLNSLDFTCYWPGKKGKLYQITNCWLSHYHGLFWSNVACVHRILSPRLANRMRQVFLETIAVDESILS
jgi:FkbM family methyltransferase